jgi:hypothetical protein
MAVTPPITISRPAGTVFRPVAITAPKVDSYDELVYACQAGDSYRSISQAYYHTPAYATALQVYNRTHWNASSRMQHDGEIVPGEKIFLPNVAKLINKHGNLVQPEPTAEGNPALRNP